MSGTGFGDSLSVAEIIEQEELLRVFYRASVHHVAKVRQPHDADFDDLVQEGVVAAWNATNSMVRKDPKTYGAVSARNRINGMQTGRYPMTGNENPGSKTYDLARQTDKREDFAVTDELLDHGNPYVAVEQRVDMQRALSVLEPQDQKLAVLVGLDREWGEIAEAVGLDWIDTRQRWLKHIKPALHAALEAA